MAETMRNPAMTAMVGPGSLDHYTIGAMTSHQMLLLTAVAVALMNILLAVRFTRAEEESGITEMLLALPVGRRSPLLAAAGVLALGNAVLALAVWVGLTSLVIDSIPNRGALLYGLAWTLQGRRDLGAGLLHAKQGRTRASAFLQTPLGLVLRLQRTAMITWGIGMLVLGMAYGSVLGDLESFFDSNELLQNMLADGSTKPIAEQFLPMLMLVMALIATIPAILAMHRLLGEEKKGRIDSILSRPVSRTRLFATHLFVAVLNGILMNTLAAAGLWLAGSSVMDTPLSFAVIMGAGAVQLPAILVMVALSALLIGAVPKASPLIWLYVVYSFFVLYLGSLFQMTEWMEKVSPFGWVPGWPIEEMDWGSIAGLLMAGLGITVSSLYFYNKREIK